MRGRLVCPPNSLPTATTTAEALTSSSVAASPAAAASGRLLVAPKALALVGAALSATLHAVGPHSLLTVRCHQADHAIAA